MKTTEEHSESFKQKMKKECLKTYFGDSEFKEFTHAYIQILSKHITIQETKGAMKKN